MKGHYFDSATNRSSRRTIHPPTEPKLNAGSLRSRPISQTKQLITIAAIRSRRKTAKSIQAKNHHILSSKSKVGIDIVLVLVLVLFGPLFFPIMAIIDRDDICSDI